MLDPKLKLRRKGDDLVLLEFPVAFSLALGVMGGVLAASLFYAGRFSFFGVILCAVSLLGALYHEQWSFSPSAIVHRRGIRPFLRTTEYTMSRIENLTLHRWKSPRGAMNYGLSFDLAEGRRVVVDNRREQVLEDWAWMLSKSFKLPLGIDAPDQPTADPTSFSMK